MGLTATAKTRTKEAAKRALRPFLPRVRGALGRVDMRLVQVSTGHYQEMANRMDDLTRRINEVVRTLEDANAPIESVNDARRSIAAVREMVLGVGERVHSHQVVLDELTFRVERLAGSSLDEMAIERRLQNLEDHILTRRD
jgi:hypothetical protein